jgi:hypothetical protein
LTSNEELASVTYSVHIHSHIDVWNQKTSAKRFELAFRNDAINSADDNIAGPQMFSNLLPLCLMTTDPRSWIDAKDYPFSYLGLRARFLDVIPGAPHQTVEVALGNHVVIDEDKAANTQMRQLLNNMGITTTQANKANRQILKNLIAVRTKKTLSIEPSHLSLQSARIGADMRLKELIGKAGRSGATQSSP